MRTLKILLVVTALILSGMVHAQKIQLVSGKLDFLKGQKLIRVTYDYSDMLVGKMKEEDYVAKKVKEYNEDTPGRGDKWRKSWFDDRTSRFQPKFELLLNKYLAEKNVIVDPAKKDAKYTMILKTTMTEPGFNIGFGRMPALINTEILFTETTNPDKILAKISITKSPGKAVTYYDFDTGLRIQEAYAKCGKALGAYLAKTAFK